MKILRVALVGIALSQLAACSSLDALNPFSSKPDPRKLPAPLVTLPAQATAVASQWAMAVGAAGPYVFMPAVVDSTVFTAAADGTLARIEGGKQVWRVSAGQALSGGVGSDGKLIAVGTPKGEVLVFGANDGKLVWSAKVGAEVLAPPLVAENTVVVRAGDARIFLFDAADGKRQRVYQRSTPALSLRAAADMSAAPGVAVAGFPGGKVVAIALNNGAAVWEATVALPKGSTELERVADVTSAPLVNGRDICAAAYQGRVACFDNGSTQARWTKDVSSSAGLDLSSRAVFVSDEQGNVLAYDRRTGASLWKQDKLANRRLSRPLVVGSLVAVGDYQGYVHFLRQDDGSLVGRFATDGSRIAAPLQNYAGGLLVLTSNGNLYSLTAN